GKWHLTPEEECHEAASRARWPLGRGFERFYGFFGGETHQFAPALVCDNHQIEPPRPWQDGYHLTEDLIDHAQRMVNDLRAVDAQMGRLLAFLRESGELDNTLVMVLSDNGASSEGGPVGSTNDNRLWNLVPHTVEDALTRIDDIGGPRCHNNYPWGWTVAGNTPFRRWKREVHEGGVADPLIVHWPASIGAGNQLRRQYTHAVDVLPTGLQAAGVTPP